MLWTIFKFWDHRWLTVRHGLLSGTFYPFQRDSRVAHVKHFFMVISKRNIFVFVEKLAITKLSKIWKWWMNENEKLYLGWMPALLPWWQAVKIVSDPCHKQAAENEPCKLRTCVFTTCIALQVHFTNVKRGDYLMRWWNLLSVYWMSPGFISFTCQLQLPPRFQIAWY